MTNCLRLLALLLLLVPAGNLPLFAKTELVQLEEEVEPLKPPEDTAPIAPSSATLDELFEKLERETKPGAANATAKLIWSEWTESGSDSINLLMYRAIRAMQQSKQSLAEDLLDQVVVLAPDYAEGWNRRATLYYTMADFRRSIADIEVTLALEPRHFGALSGLAAILQQLDREEEALKTWYRVLEIYPANPQAQQAVITLEEKLSGKRT